PMSGPMPNKPGTDDEEMIDRVGDAVVALRVMLVAFGPVPMMGVYTWMRMCARTGRNIVDAAIKELGLAPHDEPGGPCLKLPEGAGLDFRAPWWPGTPTTQAAVRKQLLMLAPGRASSR